MQSEHRQERESLISYILATGHSFSLRDIDVALACGQRQFLANVGTLAARYLRSLADADVVLDSWAWPLNNPDRPSFDAWWQELRGWRDGPDTFGNLWYAIAYDQIADPRASATAYHETMGRLADRGIEDLPVVPVLQYPSDPRAISLDLLVSWAGQRDDLVNGHGVVTRPAYSLGGLVPQRGSAASILWVESVARELAYLIDDEGIDPACLGIHLLGSTRSAYVRPLADLGVPVSCDTSTPAQQAKVGAAALKWGYSPRYGLPAELLQRSRYARLAFWLCRERDRLGLAWTTPDLCWLEGLPQLTPVLKPQQVDLFAA
jgi:hypothetical protein